MTQIIATSVCNASDRSNKNGYTNLTSPTNYTLGGSESVVILAEAVGDDGDRILSGGNYDIEYSSDGTSWLALPTSTTASIPYIAGPSALTDNSTVNNNNRRADANGTIGGTDGYVVSGREHESDNQKQWSARVDDQQTEFQVAVNFSNCNASTTWYFRYNIDTRSGTFTRDSYAKILVPAGGTTHNLTASTTTAQNDVKAAEITAQQTHALSSAVSTSTTVLADNTMDFTLKNLEGAIPDFAVATVVADISVGTLHQLSGSSTASCFDRDAGANLAEITAQQTHNITAAESKMSATFLASITAQQTHELSATNLEMSLTGNASVTGEQTHDMIGGTTESLATVSASITAQQTHALQSQAASSSAEISASITAEQTHALVAGTVTADSTASASITAQQAHGLTADTTTASTVSSALISAKQTYELASTATSAATTVLASITGQQTHQLTAQALDFTTALLGSISGQQAYSLTASATDAGATALASITAQQTHELDNTGLAVPPHARAIVDASITAQQTHNLVNTSLGPDARAVASSSITAQQAHGLTADTADCAFTISASITAQQAHSLTAQATDFAVTSSGSIVAEASMELSSANATACTISAVITAQQAHSLASQTNNSAATISGSITAQQTFNLTADTASFAVASSGIITAQQTHQLTDTTNASVAVLADITAQQTHSLSETAGTSATITALLTADQEIPLSSTNTASVAALADIVQTHTPVPTGSDFATLASASITAQQTHQLVAQATRLGVLSSGDITAQQAHNLVPSPTKVELSLQGSITAQQTHQLSATASSMPLTAVGSITAQQTHALSATPTSAGATISTSITARQTHDLVAVGSTSIGTAAGSITADQTWEINPDPDPDVVFSISAAIVVISGPQIRSLEANTVIAIATVPSEGNKITSVHDWYFVNWGLFNAIATTEATISRETQRYLSASISATAETSTVVTQTHGLEAGVTTTAGAGGEVDKSGAAGESSGSGSATATTDATIRILYDLQVVIDGVGDIEENLLTRSEIVAIEEIWNTGLTQLGVATVNSAENDTSPQAVLLRAVWPNFRKQFISDHAWNGCKTTAGLTALPDSDFKDTTRWSNIFSLPSDYIRALTVNGHRNQPDNSESVMWEIEAVANTSGVKSRCLCTNQSTAKLEYVFDVGDNVDLLAPAMKHALGLAFGAFVAPNFGKSANEIALLEQKVKEALLKARGIDGQENSARYFSNSELVEARYRSL